MKKNIFLLIITSAMSTNAFAANNTVLSGDAFKPYKGYIGLGFEHNRVDLDGFKESKVPGLVIIAGHHYRKWLDLEFRAGTSIDETEIKTTQGNNAKIRYNYNLTALMKFKWQPIPLIDLSLSTGYHYRDYQLSKPTTENQYASGLVLGGGVGFNLSKEYSINVEYLSYERYSGIDTSSATWDSGTISFQYHY